MSKRKSLLIFASASHTGAQKLPWNSCLASPERVSGFYCLESLFGPSHDKVLRGEEVGPLLSSQALGEGQANDALPVSLGTALSSLFISALHLPNCSAGLAGMSLQPCGCADCRDPTWHCKSVRQHSGVG